MFALLALAAAPRRCGALDPSFNVSFEGGNVDAVWASDNTIAYSGAIKGTSPYHAWFYFQVLNASTTAPTTLELVQSEWPEPPWLSYDDVSYAHAGNCSGSRCVFLAERAAVFVAYSTPYVTRHADALARAVAASGLGAVDALAVSEGGRRVPLVSVAGGGAAGGTAAGKTAVWLLARQHAWEASGSWVADSIVLWALSADPLAVAFRRVADLFAAPIMDVDNVVLGATGKDQQPVDFNRCWCLPTDAPVCLHWAAVRAAHGAMEVNLSSAGGYADLLFVDSHAPGNDRIKAQVWTQCTNGSAAVPLSFWNKTAVFRQLLHAEAAGAGDLAYQWACAETGPGYSPPSAPYWRISDVHVSRMFQARMNQAASTSNSYCHETDAASVADYRAYGAAIGRSWARQLQAPGGIPPLEPPCDSYPMSC